MAIPFHTTTVTILRAPPQSDGYPDTEPTYAPIATGIRAHLEIMPRRTIQEVRGRDIALSRFSLDPCDVRAFDYLRDETTERLWRVEWAEPRPMPARLAHVSGQAVDLLAEVEAAAPLVSG